ncbi:hypothetical protein TNCV_900081 [Trichonephila clavipes]|nr:hypothetical protein TNCV_900081 [Trichonephila clavipes]
MLFYLEVNLRANAKQFVHRLSPANPVCGSNPESDLQVFDKGRVTFLWWVIPWLGYARYAISHSVQGKQEIVLLVFILPTPTCHDLAVDEQWGRKMRMIVR